MKIKILENFKVNYGGQVTNFKKGSFYEVEQENFVRRHVEKGLVEIVSIMDTTDEEHEGKFEEDDSSDEEHNEESKENNPNEMKLDGDESKDYLTLKELKKLQYKDEVIEYGRGIGLEGLNDDFTRDEIENMICEYIENLKEAENEEL